MTLHEFFFKIPPPPAESMSPFPSMNYTLKNGRCCLQQILSLQTRLCMLGLSYQPWLLHFRKSVDALGGPEDKGQPVPFQILQGNDPVPALPRVRFKKQI